MRIPSLKSCLLALVARVCGNGDQQPPQAYVNKPRPNLLFSTKPKHAPKLVASDRFHSNQRQHRKDNRRANAAGVRNAFAR